MLNDADYVPVTEDLVYYMEAAMSFNNNTNRFLIEDPSWAVDFAPNGTCRRTQAATEC